MAGLSTAAYLFGQTAGNLTFGLLADRFGHKLPLELSGLAAGLAFGLAWLAPAPEWYYLVFVLLGIAMGAIIVSGILILLEFRGPERRPTYAGLGNTAVGITSMVAPLLGAVLATWSYSLLFAVGAVINLIALLAMHWWVKEPRWARERVSKLASKQVCE